MIIVYHPQELQLRILRIYYQKKWKYFKKWFTKNSLEANPTKFQSTLISSKGEKEAGRQLNVLQRLRGGSLDFNSRMAIKNTFIWYIISTTAHWFRCFLSKKSLTNIENIQKRALTFVNNGYTSSFQELLTNSRVPGIRIMTLRSLAIEV